ncbi:transporter substrate-binding domain-containing protein [Rhizobium glycinendophyticum]|uniref:Transporter substrate-binding domain-containing protein n=1 Tax=Rhizobium glycinendophyticum TaxID=2589807 RepID=A0A504ULE6_9HYPH|nr:transporter substrate-binding domain-containing protein [Rhizobium glycinendophyticum]TPP05893.1 transporter substrate-binding domain-containing protein [Rhizobium glycinendophyticum]
MSITLFSKKVLPVAGAVLLLLSFQAPSFSQQRQNIRIAVEGAFPPFNFLDANRELQGFDVELAKALCDAGKLDCEFVIQEWTAMIPDLIKKRYDAIVSSMSMSAERRAKVAFTRRYYDSPSILVKRKDVQALSADLKDLAGLKLGVTAATSQEEYAKRFLSGVETTVFHASPDLYKGLADGTVDVILEDKLAIYDWLANTRAGACCEFTGSDIKNDEFFGEGAGIAVRLDDTQLLQILDTALDEIKANGKYDEINAKYFPFSIQ